MLKAIKQLFAHSHDVQAHGAYVKLTAQARSPWFFSEQAVADTVDGRFDVVVLHMFLLIHRLRKERYEEAGFFVRALSEIFFADMDRSLREMGAGDTGVGIRVRNMAEAFYGRLQSYEQNLLKPDALKESLTRNLYRGVNVEDAKLQEIINYMIRNVAHMEQQTVGDILNGNVIFAR